MSAPNPSLFSASQIATALARSAWGVRKALKGRRPDGVVFMRGQQANAWRLESVPPAMRVALEQSKTLGAHRRAAKSELLTRMKNSATYLDAAAAEARAAVAALKSASASLQSAARNMQRAIARLEKLS